MKLSKAIAISITTLLTLSQLGIQAQTASQGPISNRVIVKFKATNLPLGMTAQQIQERIRQPLQASQVQSLSTAAGAPLTYARPMSTGAHVLRLPESSTRQDMDRALSSLRARTDIEYVEEDALMQTQAVPNDTNYSSMWHFKPVVANSNYGADFQTAWDKTTGSPSVVVAVVDTGITPHPDIVGGGGTVSPPTGNLVSAGYDFTSDCRLRGTCPLSTTIGLTTAPSPNATDLGDWITSADNLITGCAIKDSSWHGTHVSGTIAALGNNNTGVIGGAYNAKILPVRALGHCGGFVSDIADGMLWAAGLHSTIANPTPAKIINLSLGGSGACSLTYQNAITQITAAGVTVVVAAGNSNTGVANTNPANCTGVIAVAATGPSGAKAYYSNYDATATNYIALAAPGGEQSAANDPNGILSTLSTSLQNYVAGTDSYVFYQGTSMATPHVVAAAALMLSVNSHLQPADVRAILSASSSVTPFPSPGTGTLCTTATCGTGILNANLAVQNSTYALTPTPTSFNFGTKAIGSATTQIFTFQNNKPVSSPQTVANISGAGASGYSLVTNTCNSASLSPGATCSLTVSYSPTAQGSALASLTLPTTNANDSTIVGLAGWAGSSLSVDAASKTAATVSVGQSTAVAFTFTNVKSTSVTLSGVSLSNVAIMAVSADTCSNATLTAGANCSITVRVTPTVTGPYTGNVSINTTGAGDIAQSATLNGSGCTTGTCPVASSGGGGGGGCTMAPPGASQDGSLALYMLLVGLIIAVRAQRKLKNRL